MATEIGRWLAAAAVAGVTSLGAASDARSMSLEEFDRLGNLQQENFMTTVLHFYHHRYKQNPETAYKASCMVELYSPGAEGAEPALLSMIFRDMALARTDGTQNPTVEAVVERVVERECRAP